MKRRCREPQTSSWRRPGFAALVLRHAQIVTDPKKLAQLNAEVAHRKRKEEETEREANSIDA